MRKKTPALRQVDSEIILHLALNRFARQSDLFASILGIVPSYNMRRSIRRLKAYGLIESLVGDGETPLGYRLTKQGLRYAEEILRIPGHSLKSRPAYRSQFDHDCIVNEVRRILSESPIVHNFITEAELRATQGKCWRERIKQSPHDWKVPDGIFNLRTKTGTLRVALEVELSQKAKARYAKIMEAVLISRQFEIVFFLCKNERLMNIVQSEVVDARRKIPRVRVSQRSNGIYFATIEMLRTMQNDTPWTGEGNRFTLREVEESLAKK